MKYLFVTQYFYPEVFRGNEIAFDWAARGDNVTVITAIPNYPAGKFYKGYGLFRKRKEWIKGVKVIRVPVITRGKGGAIRLFLNYISFALLGSIYAFFISLFKRYDGVFAQQLSPVTMALPAVVAKKLQKCPLYLWVLDLWPESLTSAGDIHNKCVLYFFEKIVRYIYKNSDKILISSEGFERSIVKKGAFSHKIIHFPNWAEEQLTTASSYKCEIPVLPEGFIVMFAGNIGEAQDFENVMKAACLLKDDKNIKFIILGDGRKKKWVEEFCFQNGLEDSVFCLGRFPLESMSIFFDKADVMLVSLKDEMIFNLTLPAKIQAYMASAKPIVGMMNGEGSRIIKQAQCGLCAKAASYTDLSVSIRRISKMDKENLKMLGFNGLNFAKKYYDRGQLLDKLYFEILE